MHKCSLDILRCVSVAVAKLSSWRCRNKLFKASWHLKDKSKNKKLSKAQKSKPNIAWRRREKLEKGNKQQKLDFAVFSIFFQKKDFDNSLIFLIKDNLDKIYL